MPSPYTNDLFLRAVRGEQTPRLPIWLMRQAGRTDPEYVKLKAESGMTLEDLFRHGELAARISLLPKRIGVDAIIFFQDILTPLKPMGVEFVFRPGPVTEHPIRSPGDVERLRSYDVAEGLPFVGETFRLCLDALGKELPVLGFAGAPATLAVFMIEGKSFGNEAPTALRFFTEEPEATQALLDKLTDMTIDYLRYQIESGAAAVQLFESAAHLFSREVYARYALPCQQRIFEALRGAAPTIVFAREWAEVRDLAGSGADVLSLPSTVSIAEAREVLGRDQVVQGNLDNRLLATGSLEEIERAAEACIESGEGRGHIFNLSHGLLRETPFENVRGLVNFVRNRAIGS